MTTIRLTRNKGYYGVIRKLKIYADGQLIGELSSGETKEFDIPSGARELYGKMDWAKTNKFPLEGISNGQHLQARAWFSINFLRIFGISPMPIAIEPHP